MIDAVLAHDYLLVMRGAERTFAAIAECYPGSPILTLLYDEEATEGWFDGHEVATSWLQRTGVRQRGFRRLLPLFPRAADSMRVPHCRLLVTSSSAFAHGLRAPAGAVHVCYCYTPFRYAWHERERALQEAPPPLRPILDRVLARIRRWDLEAAARVSHYIAISELGRTRIREAYGREAGLVHPPVDVERFAPGRAEDFFMTVTELVRHKRVDVALEAARTAGMPITVVGTGPDLPRLRAEFGDSATFAGRLSDSELADLYARARALVVPNVEEFGIAAVEVQAAGRPVVAVRAGGVLETVVEGETGVLVEPTADALAAAFREVDFDAFSPARIRANAERFSTAEFQRRFRAEVERALAGESDPPA